MRRLRHGIALAVLWTSACAREPLAWVCPPLAPGELVISEVRGDQSGPDTWGQWLELYNGSDRDVVLTGLEIALVRLDGGATARVLVREPDIVVAAGDYAVVGGFPASDVPAHVDYGYAGDLGALYDSGTITLRACGEDIDTIVYRSLPSVGTLSLDGATTPDAGRNDDEGAWCVDDVDEQPDTTQLGVRGTPGEGNPTCST